MNLGSQSYELVEATIEEALKHYVANGSNTSITDIYLQPKLESGELVILNDDDESLASVVIKEWIGLGNESFVVIEKMFRNVLRELQDTGRLEQLCLMKPYSFVLVDKDKETIAELLLVDDQETLLLHEGLLKGLDDELDVFLKKLLED